MAARTHRRVAPGGAYSTRYTAARTPTGTEAIAAAFVTRNVPTIAGRIPPSVIPRRGSVSTNPSESAGAPRTATSVSAATAAPTTTAALAQSAAAPIALERLRDAARVTRGSVRGGRPRR